MAIASQPVSSVSALRDERVVSERRETEIFRFPPLTSSARGENTAGLRA